MFLWAMFYFLEKLSVKNFYSIEFEQIGSKAYNDCHAQFPGLQLGCNTSSIFLVGGG